VPGRRGHTSRLHISLAAPARVRIVLERTRHGRHQRVRTLDLPAKRRTLSLRLSARLAAAHYRVRVVAIDTAGHRSTEVRRSLVVMRRAR